MRSVIYGTTAVIHDGFDTDRIAASLEGDGVTVISLVTTQLVRLLEAGRRPAAAARGARRRRAGARGGARGGARPRGDRGADLRADRDRLAGDDARARRGAHASSARPDGRCSPPTCGSRTARSSSRARRWRPGSPTRTAGCTPATSAGSTRTGFLYVEDRLGDLIVTGGENVLPAEVEEVLLRHPEVADAAVVGRADAEWQEAVTAVVVLRDGAEVERRGAARALRRGARRLQGAEAVRVRRGAAAHRLREAAAQGAELGGAMERERRRSAGWTTTSRPGRAMTARQIGALFSEDVEYRYHPYDEPIRGRDAVVASWLGEGDERRRFEPRRARDLRRRLRAGRRRRRRRGRDRHEHATLSEPGGAVTTIYDNCFLMRFDADGRCSRVHRVLHGAADP